jgi:2-polyprenyl-3-methyl-5-hydroxy-6-metoxy-1,4-benzoquinol methylase
LRVARAKQYFSNEEYHRKNYMSMRRSEIVLNLLGSVDDLRILDLGSGSGIVSVPLTSECRHLSLVDYSEAALEIARARVPPQFKDKVDFEVADVLRFKGDDLYDVVLCLGVLAHVDSTDELLASVARNLRPGGRAVIQLTPTGNLLSWLFFALSEVRRVKYRRTPRQDVISRAAAHGLELVDRQRHMLVVPGSMSLLGRAFLPYDRWVSRSALSRFGTSDLLLLRKAG